MNLKSITGSIYKSSSTTPGIGISIRHSASRDIFFYLNSF